MSHSTYRTRKRERNLYFALNRNISVYRLSDVDYHGKRDFTTGIGCAKTIVRDGNTGSASVPAGL